MEQSLFSGPVHFFGQEPNISASEFLLRNHRPGSAKRVLARLGLRINLGKFKPNGMAGYTSYFFAWCSHHESYYVDYEHGYKGEIRCSDCEVEFRERQKVRNDPKLRLVVEQDGDNLC